ncbi:Phosphoglycerate mutase [Alkaliphilus metalliredigens QYMF]|uniref:Phosphoglycerate mutase n=1 Tax=Alkaliphilus metalliredigens (strain QYMF) TaxID=293826 RepID=A6TU74_ALKMQ|nr:histidine phosphatase family protein [Alkaliphilus metalliredigens]ABR49742.1 Phosphoglycerate mutase [Alkaliphilus metalliredigens QYMF]
MTRIYLIRHGETQDNYEKKLCGWIDGPLNQLGKIQAAGCGEALRNIKMHVIYTSPLKRAYETAEAIRGERQEEVIVVEELKELHFGDLEGWTMKAVQETHPDIYNGIRTDSVNFQFPNGESMKQMHERATKKIEELIEKHPNENIVIVAHSGVLRSVIAHLITGKIDHHWSFKVDHCSISIVEKVGDMYVLNKLNQDRHLV